MGGDWSCSSDSDQKDGIAGEFEGLESHSCEIQLKWNQTVDKTVWNSNQAQGSGVAVDSSLTERRSQPERKTKPRAVASKSRPRQRKWRKLRSINAGCLESVETAPERHPTRGCPILFFQVAYHLEKFGVGDGGNYFGKRTGNAALVRKREVRSGLIEGQGRGSLAHPACRRWRTLRGFWLACESMDCPDCSRI